MLLRSVSAREGLSWVRSGFAALRRRPGAALLLVLAYVGIVGLLPVLPLVGGLLSLGATQLTTLGFMQASRDIEQGRTPWPTVFLRVLQGPPRRLRQLLLLALLYALGWLFALGISALFDGGALLRMVVLSAPPSASVIEAGQLRNASLATMLAYLPVAMAFWFAPPLVGWWGMGAAQAMFTSFLIVLRNFGAFALYLLQWWGLFAAALVLGSLLAAALRLDAATGMLLLLPLTLALFAPFSLSFHASVRSLLGEP